MIELIQGQYEKTKEYYERNVSQNYFEFDFAYVPSNNVFRELDRFIWESKHQMTRFLNHYSGPVLIDLTAWNNNELNCYFDAFMYFLKDNECYQCSFITQEACSQALEDKLRSFFEIKITSIELKRSEKRVIGFINPEQEDYHV